MKKLDAVLYLSSLAAGVTMVLTTVFGVVEVSSFQPGQLPVRVVAAEPESPSGPLPQLAVASDPVARCPGCQEDRAVQPRIDSRLPQQERVLDARELGASVPVVLPVSTGGAVG